MEAGTSALDTVVAIASAAAALFCSCVRLVSDDGLLFDILRAPRARGGIGDDAPDAAALCLLLCMAALLLPLA